LAYIRHFIINLSGKIQSFTRLTKTDIPFKWDGECQQAFDEIKVYLLNSSVLAAPILRKELILNTIALDGSLGALLAEKPGRQSKCAILLKLHDGGSRTRILTDRKVLSNPNLRGEEVEALHAGTQGNPDLKGGPVQVLDDSANVDGQAG
jgi:RNase H-like domain found in reverse transcriptase